MKIPPRTALAAGSVAIIAAVNVTGMALGPSQMHMQLFLAIFTAVAIVVSVQSVTWDPAILLTALLLSLPAVIALLADGSPTWLIGPLAALLLVAAELNALSWKLHGAKSVDAAARRRVLEIGTLGGLGLLAALAVGLVAAGPSLAGVAAVLTAATALAALGYVVFGRSA
jgi:hypothetical protein